MASDEFGYLSKAKNRLNKDTTYRRLGSADLKLALAIGKEARLVTFEAFEIADVESLAAEDLRDAEIVLRMPKRDWNAYLKKRKEGRGPTLLTLDQERGMIEPQSPLALLKFERYNRSVQAFVDTCAKLAA